MRPRKFQPAPVKCNFRRRQYRDLAIRQDQLDLLNGFAKPLHRRRFIRDMYQPRRDIAAIWAIDLDHRVVPLVKLDQPPLRRTPVQVSHPLAHQRRTACRHKQNQPLHQQTPRLRVPRFSPVLGEAGIFPASLQAQNPKGQRGIDRGLRLFFIHP
jgi:hypothetical protein